MAGILQKVKKSPQTKSILITLILMSVTKVVDLKQPVILTVLRIAYFSCLATQLGLFWYTKKLIEKENDLTMMKFVEPASPMSGREYATFVATTVCEYDSRELLKGFKQYMIGVSTTLFMHLYMGFAPPLLFQTVSGFRGLYDNKEVQLYVQKKPARDDLKRPFKSTSMFGSFGGMGQILTDKRSIEEAELTKIKPL
ncbi:pho88 family protein [Schizosaccharomyces japonicus yFS275]|uniref:Pho88 family protein n=1 Tax=Schizosaccharomyces japonicus (strain yFS275 / FY16936) TaxID=402676 RepID=B6JW35_SCHJY|nr:pho88 family protein [Schizosaccharomyces japonicus yFS275]EEB05586.1 pho88 family protein [Schizosaccharomyces japonicus yFS275]